MIVYLSGIHYETDQLEIERIKSLIKDLGCDIIIPEEKEIKGLSWVDKLKFRLSYLESSEAIYMVSNWKESILARIELTAAMNDKKHLCFSPDELKHLLTTLDG